MYGEISVLDLQLLLYSYNNTRYHHLNIHFFPPPDVMAVGDPLTGEL